MPNSLNRKDLDSDGDLKVLAPQSNSAKLEVLYRCLDAAKQMWESNDWRGNDFLDRQDKLRWQDDEIFSKIGSFAYQEIQQRIKLIKAEIESDNKERLKRKISNKKKSKPKKKEKKEFWQTLLE